MADIAFGETSKPMEPEDMEEALEAFAKAAMTNANTKIDAVITDMEKAASAKGVPLGTVRIRPPLPRRRRGRARDGRPSTGRTARRWRA